MGTILLKCGIVRTTVVTPPGAFAELEELLEHRFGLSQVIIGEAHFLPIPGIVGSTRAAKVLLQDPNVSSTLALLEKVTVALVGVGTLEPSSLVASSGNIFSRAELETVRNQGAVGDICLRFYDANGHAVGGTHNDRLIGMALEGLRRVPRSIAICGGKRKFPAILGAVRGKWINTLVTDQHTAQRLVKAQPGNATAA